MDALFTVVLPSPDHARFLLGVVDNAPFRGAQAAQLVIDIKAALEAALRPTEAVAK